MPAKKEQKENLKICVRIRPLNTDYKESRILYTDSKNMIVLKRSPPNKFDPLVKKLKKEMTYSYDKVFGEESTQTDLYTSTAKDLIPFVLDGYNATVFAYGPTGTGKTYTMVGSDSHHGIMVKALTDLFSLIKQTNKKFSVKMSYLEIYNDNIFDLLARENKKLDLLENYKGESTVVGLKVKKAHSTKEVMELLNKGNDRRVSGTTAANERSSRSHAMLQVNVRLSSHSESELGEEVREGHLVMVDLAGSENTKFTKTTGKRLAEGSHINTSLLFLGNVINALAEGKATNAIFRGSKLTRLLKECLTGNCKTVMIAHVSPADIHRNQTKNTLVYADRAKKISTKTRQNIMDVNYHVTQYQKIITELKEEVKQLKAKLTGTELDHSVKGTGYPPSHDKEVEELKKRLVYSFENQMELRKELMEVDASLMNVTMEIEAQMQVIQEFENELKSKKKGRNHSNGSIYSSDIESDDEMPEEMEESWRDLEYLRDERTLLENTKKSIFEDLDRKKEEKRSIEESLPKMTNSREKKELLSLLCKVHELEIQQAEKATESMLKEAHLQRHSLLLERYDRQRSLCDKIITKQRSFLQVSDLDKSDSEDLVELYKLYEFESQHLEDIKKQNGPNRSNSVLSLMQSNKLPSIFREEKLFKPGRKTSVSDRPSTPLSLSSPIGSPQVTNPPISTPVVMSSLPSIVTSLPPIEKGKTPQGNNRKDLKNLFSGWKFRPTFLTCKQQLSSNQKLAEILVIQSPTHSQKNVIKNSNLYPLIAPHPDIASYKNNNNSLNPKSPRRPTSDGEVTLRRTQFQRRYKKKRERSLTRLDRTRNGRNV